MSKALPRTRDELRASLSDEELPAEIVERLAAQALPALLLTTVALGENSPLPGASRLGGTPDLPPGMGWPMRPPYPDAERRAA